MDKAKRNAGKIWKLFGILLIIILFCTEVRFGLAQELKNIDLNNLTRETQQMSDEAKQIILVWWIPEEYWRASFAQDPNMTQAQIEEFINVLRAYTLIAAIDGEIGSFGGVTYKSEADIRASIQIKDNQGMFYKPLSDDGVDINTKNFLLMMKPVFVNMLGPMGENMHFFVFPAKGESGQNIAQATKESTFSVKLGEKEFHWKTPLSSLLPLKICPTCKEKLNGAYKFCPWDGTKLK